MRALGRVVALSIAIATVACGATLTRGPTGWHDASVPYSIAPLADGTFLPEGWGLRGYTLKDDGFRRAPDETSGLDLQLVRTEDDGALFTATYPIEEADRAKLPEVLADRWITRIVRNPSVEDDATESFALVVATRKSTASTMVGWIPRTTTALSGRSVQVDQQATFTIVGGDGAEYTTTLSPPGSPPDRRLYVAAIKQSGGERFVLVAYGNSVAAFEKGLPDATAFARRIRF